MPAPLRGLLFGHGRMGSLHARKLAARPDVRLVVVDPDQGHPHPGGPLPDFAIVATPTSTHSAVAGPLLAAGVPTLVEKPLGISVADATLLAGYPMLAVGHSERFHPVVRAAAGARPGFVQARRLAPPPPAHLPEIDVVSDIMVHDLDLARAWLGPDWGDVRATGVGVMGGAADLAEARVEFAHGVATLVASRVSPLRQRSIQLFEPGRYWSLDLVAQTAKVLQWTPGERPGSPVALPVDARDALDTEHDAFLAMVRTGTPFPVGPADGLAAVRLTEAVRAAFCRSQALGPRPGC